MNDFIIHFNISKDDIRSLCVVNELYTCGDNKEYMTMFEKCRKGTDIVTVREVAQDIIDHSDDGFDLLELMETIINKCTWISVEEQPKNMYVG